MSLYGNECAEQAKSDIVGLERNTTIRMNIDRKIERAIAEVELLKATKSKMEKTGLLDLPIEDLRRVMNY